LDNERLVRMERREERMDIFEKPLMTSTNSWSLLQGLLIGFVIMKALEKSDNLKESNFNKVWSNLMTSLKLK
jgi:hypothetical protein